MPGKVHLRNILLRRVLHLHQNHFSIQIPTEIIDDEILLYHMLPDTFGNGLICPDTRQFLEGGEL